MLSAVTRIYNEDTAQLKRNLSETHEAFLLYNGAPAEEDDPADYYQYTKGVRIA